MQRVVIVCVYECSVLLMFKYGVVIVCVRMQRVVIVIFCTP